MRTCLAYIYFVRSDPWLNLGAAGMALFGTMLAIFAATHLPIEALIFVVAWYSTPLFALIFVLRGAGIPELYEYLRVLCALRSPMPRVLPLMPRRISIRTQRAFERAIDDWERAHIASLLKHHHAKRRVS